MAYEGHSGHWHLSLRAVRAARHRTANALQVAFGWAQLGEPQKVRESLERIVREEALLSALGRSGDEGQQYAFWQLMADVEESGRHLAFFGRPGAIGPAALGELLPQLAAALQAGRTDALAVTCGEDGITLSWPEEDQDVRR